MSEHADILVAGLGAVGSAALYQAARLGARVIGIDRFSPPHDRGSSHGDTRITRQAIGEGRSFVPLVLRSNQIWEELEAVTGRTLMTRNGALVLAPAGVSGDHHGSTSFLEDTFAAADEFDIPHQRLNAVEIAAHFPQFHLTGDEAGYFEPGAGYLRPEACIETQLAMARKHGAIIHTGETVLAIEERDGGVQIRTTTQSYSAGAVILTVGAWLEILLPFDLIHYFNVYRQVLYWYGLQQGAPDYSPANFPVFIWITGNQPSDMLYGFPAVNGPGGGVKIAGEQYAATIHADEVERTVSDAEAAAFYREKIQPRFHGLSGDILRRSTCLYTVTPDASFVVDRVSGHERVWFASACSGHGFKHSPALGEALTQEALGQPTQVDLTPFRLSRLLRQASP